MLNTLTLPPLSPSPPHVPATHNPRRASPSSMKGPIFRGLARRSNTLQAHGTTNNNNFVPQEVGTSTALTSTPLPSVASPPIVHRHIARLLDDEDHGNDDSARPSRELCMIPKKRYLRNISHGLHHNYLHDQSHFPPYPSSPAPPQHHVAVSHSESDVSIAMILATGFGKPDDENEDDFEAPRFAKV